MINVWCVRVGDKYPKSAVDSLERMVSKNISQPFKFNVLEKSKKPGWWAKLDLFYNDGPCIYFDLDTVITGDLSPIIEYSKRRLCMTKNWSSHGGFQSSVMAWSGAIPEIPDGFDIKKLSEPDGPANCRNFGWYEGFWGDQEYITANFQVEPIEPGLIVSYKYHCKQGVPEGARVVCFHGKPDYWECSESWIKAAL